MLLLPAVQPPFVGFFHCPGCGQDLPDRTTRNGGVRTTEHIFPQSLGNSSWSIALCITCNTAFNNLFESDYLKENGILRARASISGTRRRKVQRWTGTTWVRRPGQELIVRQRPGTATPEVNSLPVGTFQDQGYFTSLPEVMSRSPEVIYTRHEWHWHVRLRECLKIGLEQLFFELGVQAETLEVVQFIRSVLFKTEAELQAQDHDHFGGRLICAGIDYDVPPVPSGSRVIPHVLNINCGFDEHALNIESRMVLSFWQLGPHLLRARVRRLEINLNNRRASVLHLSQEILGVSATVARIRLEPRDLGQRALLDLIKCPLTKTIDSRQSSA